MTDRQPAPSRSDRSRVKRPRRLGWLAAAGVLALFLAGLLIVYTGRREIAARAIVAWLDSRDVPAELVFERFEADGFVGRLRAGPRGAPDLVVERVEVDLAWDGLSARPTRIRLLRPVARMSWKDGGLGYGSLDRLVRELAEKPPKPGVRGPRIDIERAQVLLTTDAGLVRILGDARVDDSKLLSLDAVVPAAVLRSGTTRADLRRARLSARSAGDRLVLKGSASLAALDGAGVGLRRGVLGLAGNVPYPDFRTKRGDGRVAVAAVARAAGVGSQAVVAEAPELILLFDGRSQGWVDALAVTGRAGLEGRAAALTAGGTRLAGVSLREAAVDVAVRHGEAGVRWRLTDGRARLQTATARSGGARVDAAALTLAALAAAPEGEGLAGSFRAGLEAGRLSQGDLILRDLAGRFDGRFGTAAPVSLTLNGSLAARGAWPILGLPAAGDDPQVAGLKRALADFRLAAPSLGLTLGEGGPTVTAGGPIRLTPASGGAAVIAPRAGRPLYGPGGGAFDLAVAGGALPRVRGAVSDYAFEGGGLRARTALRAEGLNLAFVRDGRADIAGTLSLRGGVGSFTASGCAPLGASRLELGANDVEAVAGRLCPAGGPLLRFGGGGWRLDGRAEAVEADVPFLQIAFDGGRGRVRASDGALTADIAAATVSDLAPERRFDPLTLSGRAAMRGDDWTGAFAASDHGHRMADLTLAHDGASGAGRLDIDARGLAFSEGGLQPAGLSPIAGRLVGDKVVGSADFTGLVRWSPEGAVSEGRFATAGLDFRSSLGQVTRLATDVRLTSLAPLESAPGQRATVERIDAYLPVEQAELAFQLLPDALRLESGRFRAAEGGVVLEPFAVPFDAARSWEGAVQLEGVELGRLIERSPFADRVELKARVSGRLPFAITPEGLRFMGGRLAAIEPGRLSIKRQALVDTETGGGAAEVQAEGAPAPPAAGFDVQDFAFQALENLAFDTLEAEVNSLPGGRLGVLFRIRGRHDPPARQEITLTWIEVLQRRFLDRPLPLPSDTGVNLTLDTTWNLDELLQSLREANAAREAVRSEPVQPERR